MRIANITMFHMGLGGAIPADVERAFCGQVRELFPGDIELAWTGFDCAEFALQGISDRLNPLIIDHLSKIAGGDTVSLAYAYEKWRPRTNGHDIINLALRGGDNWKLSYAGVSAILCVRYRVATVKPMPTATFEAPAGTIGVPDSDFYHTLAG